MNTYNQPAVDVMLSIHCGTMLESAKKLRDFLVKRRFTVFLSEQMSGGVDFRESININAISCRSFVAFMNKDWCVSEECQFEFQAAFRINLMNGKVKPLLIPLILEDFKESWPSIFETLCNFNGIFVKPAELNYLAWEKVLSAIESGLITPSSDASSQPNFGIPKPGYKLNPFAEAMFAFLNEDLSAYGPSAPAIPIPTPAPVTPTPTPVTPTPTPTPAPVPQKANGVSLIIFCFALFPDKGSTRDIDDRVIFASFASITSLAVGENEIYVATLAHTVKKIELESGYVSTCVGFQNESGSADGNNDLATLNSPAGIAVGSDGSLYISDSGNKKIRKVHDDIVSTLAGTGKAAVERGPQEGSSFLVALGSTGSIAVYKKSNTVYFVDGEIVRKYAQKKLTTLAGSGKAGFADGTGKAAQFHGPQGIAVVEADGSIILADSANNRIRKITPDGVVSTFAGGKKGEADGPVDKATFYFPTAVAIDPRNSDVYVVDQFGVQIRKISNGVVSTVTTLPNSNIVALAIREGVLYVAEPYTIRTLSI